MIPSWKLLSLGCLGVLLGCKTPSKELPKSESEAPAVVKSDQVSVDPALVTSGRIRTARVTDSSLTGELKLAGEVVPAPDGEAEVGALVSGRLSSLLKHEGDSVKKGEVLGWIDAPEVGMARAELVRIQAEAGLAEKRLLRSRRLVEENAIATSTVEEAEAKLGVLRAEQSAIWARLSAWGATSGAGSKVAVVAPISGEIVERQITLGSAVDSGRPLMRLVSPAGMRIRAQYPAALSRLPGTGESVVLERRGSEGRPEQVCPASVAQVSATLEPASRTVTLYLTPGDGCGFLRPFEPVEVRFTRTPSEAGAPSSSESQVTVPRDAVVDLKGVPTVFVALPQAGQYRVQAVSLKAILGNLAVLRSGVLPGEEVVVGGTLLLKGEVQKDMLGGE